MQFKEWLLTEAFDKVSDFLLNPAHRDKTFEELLKDFRASGGEFIGGGQFGQVFDHPSWPYVLKIFPHDDCYLAFARWASRINHPAFPKFFGAPQRVVPFYRRSANMARIYLARVERLYPIDRTLGRLIVDTVHGAGAYFYAVKNGLLNQEVEKTNYDRATRKTQPYVKVKVYQDWIDLFKQHPKLLPLFEGWELLTQQHFQCSPDVKIENIMQRQNGDLVWIDPLWHGSNPYADAKAALDREIDAQPPERPLNVLGGKLPKKERPKKPPKTTYQPLGPDEIPF